MRKFLLAARKASSARAFRCCSASRSHSVAAPPVPRIPLLLQRSLSFRCCSAGSSEGSE